jgi:hypothetical protein
MSEVLTAPRVITGDQTVTDGAVVIGDRALDWVGPAEALPAEYAALPRTDYPGSTVMPRLGGTGKGFAGDVRLSCVTFPGPEVIPAAFDYLYRQGGGR